MLHEIVTLILS